jgi:hypothetical protein
MLNFTEDSLNLICRKISGTTNADLTVEPCSQAALKPMMRKIGAHPII